MAEAFQTIREALDIALDKYRNDFLRSVERLSELMNIDGYRRRFSKNELEALRSSKMQDFVDRIKSCEAKITEARKLIDIQAGCACTR